MCIIEGTRRKYNTSARYAQLSQSVPSKAIQSTIGGVSQPKSVQVSPSCFSMPLFYTRYRCYVGHTFAQHMHHYFLI